MMTDQDLQFDNPLPPRVIEAVRELHAPPASPTYWTSLEQRVMQRIGTAAAPARWWQVMNGWTRGGLVAAAVLLLVVGALVARTRVDEIRTAFDSIIHPAQADSLTVPGGVLADPDNGDSRGETFRDVITR